MLSRAKPGALFANADGLEMVAFDNLNAMQMALDAMRIDAYLPVSGNPPA